MKKEMKKCPLCHSFNLQKSYQVGNYQYDGCKSCFTLFLFPRPSIQEMRKYYQKDFQYSAGLINEKLIRKRAKIILNNLKKFFPDGKTLLDVGSGYGCFLDEAKKFKLKTVGLEPAKELCQFSKKQSKVGVIIVDLETYSQVRGQKRKFDFITIIHTIEHVVNPEKMIDQAASLLNKNGILFIETPNLDSHLFNVLKKDYDFLIPPDHIWLFSKKSLQLILGKFKDLKIEKIATYSYPEHLMGIIKRLIKGSAETSKLMMKEPKTTLSSHKISLDKKIKILLFDRSMARIIHPCLNLFDKGSILEIYLKKSG